ncbi:MAG: single-stranded-DNA-specific exonuclease RecJ [Patescibacteria group bacterium]
MNYSIRPQLSPAERDQYGVMHDIVAHLLHHRGIRDTENAQKFITPDYDRDTHDPFLLKDAEKAADRIIFAIENKERIVIYADYDADGIPGAALFNDFMKRIGYENYSVYIPHRHNEGFGLNVDAVDLLAGEGAELLITLDCGISDVEAVARANEKGIDVIITDHHEPPPELPAAFAIIDHKQLGCEYPDKNLCGSAVAYKFIQAILKKNRLGLKEGHEKWLLDLVGIATLSDMVPLTGENRVFASYGMQVLRKSPRKGLVRLLAKLKIAQAHLTEDDIAFMVTPRINAASRMGVPMDAFKLLAADNDVDAESAATHLDEINNERKGVVASLVKEVKKTVRDRHGESVPSVIVLGNPEWRPSLLGLAANSCAEEFRRPVFLWGRDGDNLIKGSCRSEGQSNVVEIMRAVPVGVLTQFGGHKYSGGFGVTNESVHFLDQRLNEAAQQIEETKSKKQKGNGEVQEIFDETDYVDMVLSLDEVTWTLNNELSKLAPFGIGNEKPLFLFKNVAPVTVKKFGKGSEHIELGFKKSNGSPLPAISFFGVTNEWANTVEPNKPLDLVASIEKSMFRGRPELRLRVVDVLL